MRAFNKKRKPKHTTRFVWKRDCYDYYGYTLYCKENYRGGAYKRFNLFQCQFLSVVKFNNGIPIINCEIADFN